MNETGDILAITTFLMTVFAASISIHVLGAPDWAVWNLLAVGITVWTTLTWASLGIFQTIRYASKNKIP